MQREGYRIEKRILETEPGISVPVLLFLPAANGRRLAATIYVQPEGKAAGAMPGGDMEALVRAGRVVLAPDLRGWGESANTAGRGVHNGRYQTATRALLVGKTMIGMQVFDLLRCVQYAKALDAVDARNISVLGKGNGGIVALFAAALDPGIARVAMEGTLPSYLDMTRSRLHEGLVDAVIPGILKSFDLPEVAASISPRPLWLVAPRTPTQAAADLDAVRKEYAGAGEAFRVTDRPEGWTFEKVYAEWLEGSGR